jgi:Lrp/AsnC family leucine-responsive transcriptional regulator
MLDQTDAAIVSLLQENARVAQAEIARAVGLAPSAVLERLRKLEARGVLRGYAALVDPAAVELGQLAFVAVRTVGSVDVTDRIGEEIAGLPEVLEVHHVAGDDCYLLKVRARDAQQVGQLLRHVLKVVPGVSSTRTTIVLDTLKETPRLPLRAVEAKATEKKADLAEEEAGS